MAKSGKSQYAILGMLGLLKRSSGYDLKKHMEATTQYFWKETFSSIYPVLEELEEQKLVVRVKNTTKNDRKRNVYALTSKGHDVFETWLKQPAEKMQIRNEFMLKLFFGNMVPVSVTIEHLEKQKKELKKKLSNYQEIKHQLEDMPVSGSLYSLITLDHGIKHVLASLEWCDDAIKTLKSIRK